jgi:hypothetical protein
MPYAGLYVFACHVVHVKTEKIRPSRQPIGTYSHSLKFKSCVGVVAGTYCKLNF